ncbi:hypothetical protein ACJX0J_034655, partial [Zea mays]
SNKLKLSEQNFIGYVGKHKGFFLHLYKDIRSPQIQRTLIFTATILLAIDISEIYVNDLYAKLFINVFNSWQYEKSGLLDGLLELGGAGVMESTFSAIEIEAIIHFGQVLMAFTIAVRDVVIIVQDYSTWTIYGISDGGDDIIPIFSSKDVWLTACELSSIESHVK